LSTLKLYALGGLGEFGKNLMVLQQGQDAIMLDCGALFTDGRNPGIDLIIPDFNPLLDPKLNLHGMILTHGHEDHIGSVVFFLQERNIPVYGGPFTHGLLKRKEEYLPVKLKMRFTTIGDYETFDVGPFTLTGVPMAHSIPEALGFFVDTAVGSIFHTGDFKLDDSPADGRSTDLEKIKAMASDRDMLLLTSDSTNVLVPGLSKSETSIQDDMQRAFDETTGRLVITSFASHIPRVTQVLSLAEKNNRKVLVLGRSFLRNIDLANDLGIMKRFESLFVDEKQAMALNKSDLMILATGSQAEPRAALSKLVFGQIKGIALQEEDRVVFSSRAIPGHERSIYHLINHIYRTGAEVWTWSDAHVHVSGHAYRDDLELMIKAVNPRYMLPVHGELRMLKKHGELAVETGIPKERVFFIENGDVLSFDDKGFKAQLPRIELYPKLVDQNMLVDMATSYLKKRRKIAESGIVVAVIAVDLDRNELLERPRVEAVGFVDDRICDDVMMDIEDALERKLWKLFKKPFHGDLKQEIVRVVNQVTSKELKRKPVVVPIVLT